MTNFARPERVPHRGPRALRTTSSYFSAKHLGAVQYYLMTVVDKDGEPLDEVQHLSPERARRSRR